jgi:hypothetical protein
MYIINLRISIKYHQLLMQDRSAASSSLEVTSALFRVSSIDKELNVFANRPMKIINTSMSIAR